jgi:hypothetical protein
MTKSSPTPPSVMLRKATIGALVLLMLPIAGSILIEDWHWNLSGFVLAYVLFFLTGLTYQVVTRTHPNGLLKIGVALALLTSFALGWTNMVHVSESDNPANLWYFSVLLVGIVGAAIMRFEGRRLSPVVFLMAAVLAVLAFAVPSGVPLNLSQDMMIGRAVFVLLFLVAGFLIKKASANDTKASANDAAVLAS